MVELTSHVNPILDSVICQFQSGVKFYAEISFQDRVKVTILIEAQNSKTLDPFDLYTRRWFNVGVLEEGGEWLDVATIEMPHISTSVGGFCVV